MTASDTAMVPWSVKAINLPEHADNPIHTDAGAMAAGYPAAIVAGTSVYAYMTHLPAAAWGRAWLTGGGGELKLKRGVLDGDLVSCEPDGGPDGDDIAVAARVDAEIKATLDVWSAGDAPAMRPGDDLPDLELTIDDEWGRYGVRAGDDLALYGEEPLAHPAIWPSLANRVFKLNLITGPWIHTRSRIHHQGPARLGDRLRIRSTVVDRFETRAGKRAVVDLAVTAYDPADPDSTWPVARIEHEAITDLNEG